MTKFQLNRLPYFNLRPHKNREFYLKNTENCFVFHPYNRMYNIQVVDRKFTVQRSIAAKIPLIPSNVILSKFNKI